MGWLTKRRIKKFVEKPDSMLIVNPRFCDHDFGIYENPHHGRCRKCGISLKEWRKEQEYTIGGRMSYERHI